MNIEGMSSSIYMNCFDENFSLRVLLFDFCSHLVLSLSIIKTSQDCFSNIDNLRLFDFYCMIFEIFIIKHRNSTNLSLVALLL